MKRNADQLYPAAEHVWKGGSTAFIFKGTNGRWKDVLSPEELALYGEAVARVMPPDCAAWLEHGWVRSPNPYAAWGVNWPRGQGRCAGPGQWPG